MEELEQIRKVYKTFRELNEEIKAAYNTYRSPVFSDMPRIRKTAGERDPVLRALDKIEKLREKQAKLIPAILDFENRLDQIGDHEIRAIIRSHYINGDSWRACTKRILNISGSDCAKHRVYRYFHVIA